MSHNNDMNFSEYLQKIIDEDVLIERVKIKSKVPNLVVRQIVAEVGLSLPKIYDKLYDLGYAVPITDFRKGSDQLPKSMAAKFATFKPFRILLSAIMLRSRAIQ